MSTGRPQQYPRIEIESVVVAPSTKPTVTGSRGDGTALVNLLAALVALGLITDATSA